MSSDKKNTRERGMIPETASVVFHSVCGNVFLMAQALNSSLNSHGISSTLYRVPDRDSESLRTDFPVIDEYYDALLEVPEITPEELTQSDLLALGSPTYFGNVSGQMKLFMDRFAPLWESASFRGTRLLPFTSVGTPQGGGDRCLEMIRVFGTHMGMLSLPFPADLTPAQDQCAYGFLHYSGATAETRPGKKDFSPMESMAELISQGLF